MNTRTRVMLALALSFSVAATSFAADTKADQAQQSSNKKADRSSKSTKSDKSGKSEKSVNEANYPAPAGLRGFDGTLIGTVTHLHTNTRGFVLKVKQVVHSNPRSTASNAESAVGQEILVRPSVVKEKNGKQGGEDREMNYIKSLQEGQDIQIDLTNSEGDVFRIAELTKAEQDQADREKAQTEKKAEKKADKKKD